MPCVQSYLLSVCITLSLKDQDLQFTRTVKIPQKNSITFHVTHQANQALYAEFVNKQRPSKAIVHWRSYEC